VGIFSKTCSVCAAERELTEAVDKLLDQKPRARLRDIATQVGCFSKSSIHRHSKHYVKSNLPRIYRGERIHTLWPGQSLPANAREQDWVIQIEYEKPLAPKSAPNPSALLSAEEKAALEQAQPQTEIIPEPANGNGVPPKPAL
jgi:hypothetical protein